MSEVVPRSCGGAPGEASPRRRRPTTGRPALASRPRRAHLPRLLDQILTEEAEAKQKKRVAVGIQIAHFPAVKTLEDFDFEFQPSVDQKLVKELGTGRFVAGAQNVLLFGPRGVGKTPPGRGAG